MFAIIKVTNRCNLNCLYCSMGDFSIKNDLLLKKYCDFIKFITSEDYANEPLKILFHGGEPLLIDIDFYEKAIDFAKKSLKKFKPEFLFQTNGTILDSKWIDFFKNNKIKVGVSIDGIKDIHNRTRGNFKKVLENIKILKKNKIDVSCLCVISSYSIGIEQEIINFFNNLGVYVKFNPVSNIGRAKTYKNVLLKKLDYGKFLKRIFIEIFKNDYQINVEPITSILNLIIWNNKKVECTFIETCLGKYLCVNSDGSIYNCGRFVGKKDFKFNNTLKKRFLNRLENIKTVECKSCKYLKYCYGGCPADSIDNSFFSKSIFCEDYKYFFDFIFAEGLDIVKKALVKRKIELKNDITFIKQRLEHI